MIQAWGPILPGWRWLYGLQPISDRPTGLGFQHRAGRYRPGGLRFSSPGCRSCRDAQGCLNWGWGRIISGFPSLYIPQPISDRPVELGFSHLAGGVDSG